MQKHPLQIHESHILLEAWDHCIPATLPISNAALVTLIRNTLKELGKRVKIVIVNTCPEYVRMPFEKLVAVCRGFEGVQLTLIDGAHGVGHIKIDLGSLKPGFLVSIAHKHVNSFPSLSRFDLSCLDLDGSSPPVLPRYSIAFCPISLVFEAFLRRGDTSPSGPPFVPGHYVSSYQQAFGEVTSSMDACAYLSLLAVVQFRNEICGGHDAITKYIRNLARTGGDRVAEILGTEVMNNEEGTFRQCTFANPTRRRKRAERESHPPRVL
jgi:hypothetical protein